MSGCHVPETNGDYFNTINEIESLKSTVKQNWEMTYKSDDNLSKRINELDSVVSNIIEDLSKEVGIIEENYQGIIADLRNLEEILKKEIPRIYNAEQIGLIAKSAYDGFEKRLLELERRLDVCASVLRKDKLSPHKCPACDFSGAIQLESMEEIARFKDKVMVTDGRHFIWCRSCEGKGIVWG
jgi:hypothetical protein